MDIEATQKKIIKKFTGRLLAHSQGVEVMARRLAAVYGEDAEKTALAAIAHDYGKIYSYSELLQIAVDNNIVDEVSLQEPALLHAPVGSWLLEHEWGIDDPEILHAVKIHTTGAVGMSNLAAIIYLADYIEPGRSCPGVGRIRELAFQDLHKALLSAVDSTIKYVLERQGILHPDSIMFRNWLIIKLRKTGQELLGHEIL